MNRLLELLKSKFLRRAGAISGGAAAAQALTFLASPLLTRLYGPEAFGVLALFLAFVTFAAAASSLHYEMAIALPKSDEGGAAVTLLAVSLAFVSGSLSVFVFAPTFLDLAGKLGYEALARFWWMLPVTIFGSGLQQALTLWYLRRHRFSQVAQNGILQSLSQNGFQIVFGVAQMQSIGLLLGLTLSRFVAGITLITRKLREDRILLLPALRQIRPIALEFKAFPSIGLFGAILHIACFQLPSLILADLYGAKIAGWYIVQDRVLTVPLAVLAQGVASVFYVDAARWAHEDPAALKRSYFQILRNLSLVGLGPMLVLIAFGPWLFKTIFGDQWETAGQYARILAIPTFLRFVAGPLFRCLTILKRQAWIFICDGLGLLCLLTASSYLASTKEGSVWVITAIAIAISLTYAGLLTAATLAILKHALGRGQTPLVSRPVCGLIPKAGWISGKGAPPG